MGFLEQPFSTPIIYNPEKKRGILGGEMLFPPYYNYSRSDYIPIIYNQGPIIYNQGPIIYNRIFERILIIYNQGPIIYNQGPINQTPIIYNQTS